MPTDWLQHIWPMSIFTWTLTASEKVKLEEYWQAQIVEGGDNDKEVLEKLEKTLDSSIIDSTFMVLKYASRFSLVILAFFLSSLRTSYGRTVLLALNLEPTHRNNKIFLGFYTFSLFQQVCARFR